MDYLTIYKIIRLYEEVGFIELKKTITSKKFHVEDNMSHEVLQSFKKSSDEKSIILLEKFKKTIK